MKQSVILARNSTIGLIHQLVSIGITLLLLPYVISNVGKGAYGIYILMLGLVQLFRFLRGPLASTCQVTVAHCRETGEVEEINRVLGTSVKLAVIPAVLGGAAVAASGEVIYQFFDVAPEYHDDTIITAVMAGLTVLLVFPLYPFSGVVAGYQRQDLAAIVGIVLALAKVGLIVALFTLGFRAVWVVMLVNGLLLFLNQLAGYIIARRLCPEMRLVLRGTRRQDLRLFVTFGSMIMLTQVFVGMNEEIPKWIAGKELGPPYIAFLHVCMLVAILARRLVQQVSVMAVPVSARYRAMGRTDLQLELLTRGSRYGAMMAGVALAPLIPLADRFLELWMGNEFVWLAPHMQAMAIIVMVTASGSVAFHMAVGARRPGIGFCAVLVQGVVAAMVMLLGTRLLGLGLWGIVGGVCAGFLVFWGMCTFQATRLFHSRWLPFILGAYLRTGVIAGVAIGAGLLYRQYVDWAGWSGFIAGYATGGVVFVLANALTLTPQERELIGETFTVLAARVGRSVHSKGPPNA
jgi:O-antigen/teichoic acid export membrane protein